MSRRLALAGFALAFAAATAALGQGAGSSLKGHDTDAPVDVAADRIEVQDRADRATKGAVRLLEPALILVFAGMVAFSLNHARRWRRHGRHRIGRAKRRYLHCGLRCTWHHRPIHRWWWRCVGQRHWYA